jgi:hypothetical protein
VSQFTGKERDSEDGLDYFGIRPRFAAQSFGPMTSEFEQIEAIQNLANGRIGNELYFADSEALQAIDTCSEKEIAVLGVEIFRVRSGGFQAQGCSDYEVPFHDWLTFVEQNNALATQCLRQNAAGDEHVYVLTTSSQNEFRQLRGHRK